MNRSRLMRRRRTDRARAPEKALAVRPVTGRRCPRLPRHPLWNLAPRSRTLSPAFVELEQAVVSLAPPWPQRGSSLLWMEQFLQRRTAPSGLAAASSRAVAETCVQLGGGGARRPRIPSGAMCLPVVPAAGR